MEVTFPLSRRTFRRPVLMKTMKRARRCPEAILRNGSVGRCACRKSGGVVQMDRLRNGRGAKQTMSLCDANDPRDVRAGPR